MKNYNEMAQSVICRSNAIIKKRKEKRKWIIRATSAVLSCVIVVLAVAGIFDKSKTGDINSVDFVSPTHKNNTGVVNYLSLLNKNDTELSGTPFKYIGSESGPSSSPAGTPPRHFALFFTDTINVVARVVEEYPGEYRTLREYADTKSSSYRLFKMEVIDSLGSNLSGEFFYVLPYRLKGDLAKYDALVLSMNQLQYNLVLRNENELVAFEYIFKISDSHNYMGYHKAVGNIIPFSNGVFDETLYEEEGWNLYYYYEVIRDLDKSEKGKEGSWIAKRGMKLEEIIEIIKKESGSVGYDNAKKEVKYFENAEGASKTAFQYVKPFENGIFVPSHTRTDINKPIYYRYINGCPTNEWVEINILDNTVKESEYKFCDEDFENLPNIAQYIEDLDLSEFSPQHTDERGKKLYSKIATGFYEKTADGVYSIVKIAWFYKEDGGYGYECYCDETFILLDEKGDRVVSREELISLIGKNKNISDYKYGAMFYGPPLC